jgi:hypothetical protein
MRKLIRLIFSVVTLCCSNSNLAHAGEFLIPDSTQTAADSAQSRQLLLSLDFLSNKTYLGRQNIVTEKFVAPALAYLAPSGFFSGLAVEKIVDPENRFDRAELTLGWMFNLWKKGEASFSYTRFTFSDESRQVGASLRNNLEATFKRETNWITPQLYLDMYFGKAKPDFGIRFELFHDFEFDSVFTKRNDALIISPSVSLTAATLNFYSVYLRDSTQLRTIKNIGVNVNTRFQLASIDLALPVEYDIGRFMFVPELRHTIPLENIRNSDNKPATYFNLSVGYFLIDD